LFVKRTTVVTPTDETPEKAAHDRALWKSLGSRIVRMTPEAMMRRWRRRPCSHVVASALAGHARRDPRPTATDGSTARVSPPPIRNLVGDSYRQSSSGGRRFEKSKVVSRVSQSASMRRRRGAFALLDEGRTRREAARGKPKAPVK
jgi:prephenate dehydrogenase